jgi:DNA-binding MarR family transcriptional regulator
LEKLGFVSTARSKRDARLALASLTPSGQELVEDAAGVVNDTMKLILERSPKTAARMDEMIELLEDFGH